MTNEVDKSFDWSGQVPPLDKQDIAALSLRSEADLAWLLTPSACRAKLQPWFRALKRAPLRCFPPAIIVEILDAIRHGGNWVVWPAKFNGAWDCALQTVGGMHYELTFWQAANSSAFCGVSTPFTPVDGLIRGRWAHRHSGFSDRGEILGPSSLEKARIEKRRVTWKLRPALRIGRNDTQVLTWRLTPWDFGHLSCGEMRVSIHGVSDCAPSAVGCVLAPRIASTIGRKKAARPCDEQAGATSDSYGDDDDPISQDSGEENLADNFGGFGEDSD